MEKGVGSSGRLKYQILNSVFPSLLMCAGRYVQLASGIVTTILSLSVVQLLARACPSSTVDSYIRYSEYHSRVVVSRLLCFAANPSRNEILDVNLVLNLDVDFLNLRLFISNAFSSMGVIV